MENTSVFVLVLHLTLFTLAYGACYLSENKKADPVLGESQSVCEYEGMTFLPGSRVVTTDCHVCTCGEEVMACCSFGKSLRFPEFKYCDYVEDYCFRYAVMKSNHSLDCDTNLPFKRRSVMDI